MTDIKQLLQDADPVRSEEPLSPAEARVLRTAMLEAAATAPKRAGSIWYRPLAVATIAIVLIGISGATGDRAWKQTSSEPHVPDPVQGGGSSERRQIQFSTPGGTRIIWILDPGFSVQDSSQETKP
jgi:hypothetical protein